jgi:hypothetical protein
MFRLKIDMPLGNDETQAKKIAEIIMTYLSVEATDHIKACGVEKVQYLMSQDEDTKARNYLVKDSQGHCTTKKCVINLLGDQSGTKQTL